MTFRLILDEMISPHISRGLWEAGVDNYAIRDRGLLQASDYQVWTRAKLDARTLVTINEVHFRRFAETEPSHCGIIVIPDGAHAANNWATYCPRQNMLNPIRSHLTT